jgi:hypothetical protein
MTTINGCFPMTERETSAFYWTLGWLRGLDLIFICSRGRAGYGQFRKVVVRARDDDVPFMKSRCLSLKPAERSLSRCWRRHSVRPTRSDRWELAWLGPILDFRFAWIDKRFAGHDLLRLASCAVLEEVFPRYSLLIMKACALEYANAGAQGERRLREARRRREMAMVRYYSRVFNAQRLPGAEGQEGWLLAPHPKLGNLVKPRALTNADAST